MPAPALFAKLGVFVRSQFLDEAVCAEARAVAASSAQEASRVLRGAEDDVLYLESRRSSIARVDGAMKEAIQQRFLELIPALSEHFGEPLSECETAKFLVYRAGDYFRPHHDSSQRPEAPATVRKRRVSAVVFLNATTASPPTPAYQGGGLVLYGLMGGERGANMGLELDASTGLLVAFRASTIHEVTPITDGERYTLVTWFR